MWFAEELPLLVLIFQSGVAIRDRLCVAREKRLRSGYVAMAWMVRSVGFFPSRLGRKLDTLILVFGAFGFGFG